MPLSPRSLLPPAPEPTTEEKPAETVPTGKRRAAARAVTVLALLLVLFALIAPNEAGRLTLAAFVRVPLEGVLGLVLLLVLRGRARAAAVAVIGAGLGALAILKIIDIGFSVTLDRSFRPLFDWPLLTAGLDLLGRPAGAAVAVAAVALAAGTLVLMTLSVRRLARLAAGHRRASAGTAVVLGAAWGACAVLGAQIVPGVPVAAVVSERPLRFRADLQDRRTFAAQVAQDGFRATPGGALLTGLRGKDVLFSFVESYGRDSIEDPRFAPRIGAVLDAGDRRLRAAGFASRSAFLSSPTAGGGSWLAHSTLLSGLWIDNPQRHDSLMRSDRLTLTRAFQRADWRTVAFMPGNTKPWPEGAFYGLDRVYNQPDLGYRGPPFNWGTPPDQYTLSAFQRTERAAPGHAQVMAEIPLVSSHSPWAPRPQLIDWDDIGDGSAFAPIAASAESWEAVWRDPARIRAAYRKSIEYSLNTLISYMEKHGDDLVLVFLGDHQPAPLITGQGAGRDVPVTIVARDPAVLDRVSGWGWQDGLKPGPHAPVWRMDAFRDRFLTAFGPQGR